MAETLVSLRSKVLDLLSQTESLLPLLHGSDELRVSKLRDNLVRLNKELSYLDATDDLSRQSLRFQTICKRLEPVLKPHLDVRRIDVGGAPPLSLSAPCLILIRQETEWVLEGTSPTTVTSAQEVASVIGRSVVGTNDLDIWRSSRLPEALTGPESRFWKGFEVRLVDEDLS
ncbi:MAG: hypothetical protein GX162_13025 [Firmicutes bacterium]|jgi:hypothetical protein|nr:hypothetical protein [Bacillota bacterium]